MNIEEFEELINAIPKVESDNLPVSTMNSINVEDLRNAVKRFKKIPSYQELLEENQELKKQLEDYKKWYQDELEENAELSDLWINRRARTIELENQQKEFIEWLDNESKELIRDAGYHQRICIEIMEKYKEIIGEKDE